MPTPGQELSSIDFESMIGGPLVAVVNAQAQAAISTTNFIKEVGFKKLADDQDPEKGTEVGDPIYVTFKYPKEISAYQPPVGPGDGSIGSINVIAAGSGYAAAPVVTIAAPPAGGTQATATANIDAGGAITDIAINNAGSGYTSAPNVTIAAPAAGGTQATASATVNTAEVRATIQQMKLEVPILTILPIPYLRVELVTIDFNAKINSVEYRKTDSTVQIDSSTEAKAGWLWGSAKLKVSASYKRNTQQGTNVERTYALSIHVQAVQDEMPGGMERVLGILEDAISGQPLSAAAPNIV